MDTHGVSSVEVVSGLVRQDNFVPSRRFREDDRENLQSCQRGGGGGGACQNKYSWRSRRGETKTKPGDSLQVPVEPVVHIP